MIVVEHDEETIRVADHVVDIGPGAGEHGGAVVYAGPVKGLLRSKESLTGQYLSGKRSIPVPEKRRKPGDAWLTVARRARAQPAGHRRRVPARLLGGGHRRVRLGQVHARQRHPATGCSCSASTAAAWRRASTPAIEGVELLDKVIDIDQSPIGRTPRSNPATYTGVFDHVRKLFAQTSEAKVRGYLPGRFSFNVKGGRCEACAGDGTIKIEMHFLPDVYVPCEVCKGARYNRDTLEVTFKGKNIADVLELSCEEALEFFGNQPAIARHMQTLVDVGLGYIRLGPAGHHAVGRRGAARQARLASCPSAPPGTRSTSSTSRPRACTSTTSASSSRCCHGWSTRATRCSSSSTTST